jgi:putative DNA primase/helicase
VLPVLEGARPSCTFTLPQENVLVRARHILVESGRVYTYGNSIVMEVEGESGRQLATVTNAGRAEQCAASMLCNLMICEYRSMDGTIQFPPPRSLVELLLNSDPTRAALPRIETYANRPVFDRDFSFLGNGWHPSAGVLVHGPAVEPVVPPSVNTTGRAIDRLPTHLRRLLAGFCFVGDADVINTVGAMLTGLLPTHFQQLGKALVLVDGNQPGVGKTLLVRTIGMVLDDGDPRVVSFTADEEELNKRTCAILRGRPQSILIYDNAKTTSGRPISSPFIESNSMASHICLRILGQSANIDRPNDVVWAITMNNTKTSPDLVSRGLPIRLHYEGLPEDRDFGSSDPIAYAKEHRAEILGELAGMVIRWNQAGRPMGDHGHRCRQWAGLIGGILQVNGLPEFLTNLDEAAGEFNTQLDELAALAEAAVTSNMGVVFIPNNAEEVTDQ